MRYSLLSCAGYCQQTLAGLAPSCRGFVPPGLVRALASQGLLVGRKLGQLRVFSQEAIETPARILPGCLCLGGEVTLRGGLRRGRLPHCSPLRKRFQKIKEDQRGGQTEALFARPRSCLAARSTAQLHQPRVHPRSWLFLPLLHPLSPMPLSRPTIIRDAFFFPDPLFPWPAVDHVARSTCPH